MHYHTSKIYIVTLNILSLFLFLLFTDTRNFAVEASQILTNPTNPINGSCPYYLSDDNRAFFSCNGSKLSSDPTVKILGNNKNIYRAIKFNQKNISQTSKNLRVISKSNKYNLQAKDIDKRPILKAGWPLNLGIFEFPAASADLDRDGKKDLIFTVFGPDMIVALHDDGSAVNGWPVNWRNLTGQSGSSGNPAIGDIDGDHLPDVVGSPLRYYIYAFNNDGTVKSNWPVDLRKYVLDGNPSPDAVHLADLDGDGKDDVVVTCYASGDFSYIFAFNGKGEILSGWPVRLPLQYFGSGMNFVSIIPSSNLSNNHPHVFVLQREGSQSQSTLMGTLLDYRGQIMPGWPVTIDHQDTYYNPVIADINGDKSPEIIFVSSQFNGVFHKYIYVLELDGTPLRGWPINLDFLFPDGYGDLTNPTIGDIDGDGLPELVTSAQFSSGSDGKIAVFDYNGNLLPGWPVYLPIGWMNTPVIVDINNDSIPELIGGGLGSIFALDTHGNMLAGWPVAIGGYSNYSNTIDNFDNDGEMELLVGGGVNNSIYLYDLRRSSASNEQWPMYLHDSKRTGAYGF